MQQVAKQLIQTVPNWAKANVPAEQIKLDEVVTQVVWAKITVAGLKAQYDAANGVVKVRPYTGKTATTGDVFRSQADWSI